MSKRDPNILLEDVALAIEKIGLFTAGMDREMFLGDAKTIDAVARNLEIIGEAVRQLPDDFTNALLIFHGSKSEECEIGLFMSTSAWTWKSFGRLFTKIFLTWEPASVF
jgi:hypothetical protein